MTRLERCIKLLAALDPDFSVDLQVDENGKFSAVGSNGDGDAIYEPPEWTDTLDQAVDDLWDMLKRQADRRALRTIGSLLDEEE